MRRRHVHAFILLIGATAEWHCARSERGGHHAGAQCLVAVNDVSTAEAEKLPVIATLVDIGTPRRQWGSGCAEYGGEDRHEAKLGPLAATYTSIDYKGQPIASNTELSLSSPTCPGAVVRFTMAAPSLVRLHRDEARDLLVVSGGILDRTAIGVRMSAPRP